MPAVQSTYSADMPVAVVGQLANMELWNSISRTVETVAGIGFGQLVVQGAAANGIILPTAVLVTAGTPVVTGAGNGVLSAITFDQAAQVGTFTISITGAASATAAFSVFRPDGSLDGTGAVGTAYNGTINFSLADGATDWATPMSIAIPAIASGGGVVRGITMRDPTLAGATPDLYARYSTAAVLTRGVIWVTAGATVSAGDSVWFVPSTGRFTNIAGATNVLMANAMFDSAAVNAGLVKIRLGNL